MELRATLGEGERFVSLQRLLCNILQFVCCRKTSSVFVFMEVHGSSWKFMEATVNRIDVMQSCITRHHCHSVPRCHGMPWDAMGCHGMPWDAMGHGRHVRLRRGRCSQ